MLYYGWLLYLGLGLAVVFFGIWALRKLHSSRVVFSLRNLELTTREETLGTRNETLDIREWALVTREETLGIRRKMLNAREENLSFFKGELNGCERVLGLVQKELDERERVSGLVQEQLDTWGENLKFLQGKLDERERFLDLVQKELGVWEEASNDREKELNDREETLVTRKKELDCRSWELITREETLVTRKKELDLESERLVWDCPIMYIPKPSASDIAAENNSLAEEEACAQARAEVSRLKELLGWTKENGRNLTLEEDSEGHFLFSGLSASATCSLSLLPEFPGEICIKAFPDLFMKLPKPASSGNFEKVVVKVFVFNDSLKYPKVYMRLLSLVYPDAFGNVLHFEEIEDGVFCDKALSNALRLGDLAYILFCEE